MTTLQAIGTIAGSVIAVVGLVKLIAYYATKSTQQKIDQANAKIDQDLDKFEETGRPQ